MRSRVRKMSSGQCAGMVQQLADQYSRAPRRRSINCAVSHLLDSVCTEKFVISEGRALGS